MRRLLYIFVAIASFQNATAETFVVCEVTTGGWITNDGDWRLWSEMPTILTFGGSGNLSSFNTPRCNRLLNASNGEQEIVIECIDEIQNQSVLKINRITGFWEKATFDSTSRLLISVEGYCTPQQTPRF
ncbi:hypothetical protein MWN63_04890 [Paradonghicola geojensis]|nr:hypothetical protein [Marivivens geojensis]